MARSKILMACSNYWTSPFNVGSHHWAREFVSRGYEVAYISDPISPMHVLGSRSLEWKERRRIYDLGGLKQNDGLLWAYVPGTLASPHPQPLLRSPWLHRNWFRMTRPSILPYVQHQGFGKVDLLYIDSLVQSFWLGRIEAKKTLFRMTDDLPSLDKATPSFAKVERELIQQADAVTYTSRVLEKKIFPLKPKRTFYVPAGVHLKDFAVSETRILPDEYKKIPKPIAVYVGSIGSRFDDQLLSLTARRLPKVSFVLIGPEKEARQKLPNLSNLYLLGTKPYDSIPPYLWNAALGLIPLNVRRNPGLVHSTHPLKLYQYLACGLPVVSTDWETIRDLHSPALLSRNFEGFVKNIKTALDQPKPVRNNIRFARKHEWKNRLKEIFYWLEEAPSTVRQVRAGKGSK